MLEKQSGKNQITWFCCAPKDIVMRFKEILEIDQLWDDIIKIFIFMECTIFHESSQKLQDAQGHLVLGKVTQAFVLLQSRAR